jgi:hypothetical protein
VQQIMGYRMGEYHPICQDAIMDEKRFGQPFNQLVWLYI